MTNFARLTDELDRWAGLGLTARLWLRDDDATQTSAALVRLARLSSEYTIPMLIAVIPGPARSELRGLFDEHRLLQAAVHGYRHQNFAAPGQKSIELGGERKVADICNELAAALQLLSPLFAARLTGILVPPWNRISQAVVQRLPELGFTHLSTFGDAREAEGTAGLVQINTHLDIIDWKGTRGGRDPEWLTGELVKLLQLARAGGGVAPIGVLSHHLDHDDVAWAFLERLFALTSQHPAVEWQCPAQITSAVEPGA